MAARAQTCVVCMEEKEHTLVPPHREADGTSVEGHRFCTDCWVTFLRHGMWQQRRAIASKVGAALPPLACPLCRGTIDVPDVWGLNLAIELPASWRPPSPVEKAYQPCSQSGASHSSARRSGAGRGLQRQPSLDAGAFWADAARPGFGGSRGSSISASSSSTQASEHCALQRNLAPDDDSDSANSTTGSQPPSPSVSMWRALACPMAGCFKRLQRAMANDHHTLVEDVNASEDVRSDR